MAWRTSCMTESGQAHQAPSCTGCHSARKPLPPAKHANPDNCGTLEGQNTPGFKKQQKCLVPACIFCAFLQPWKHSKPSDSWWTMTHKQKTEKPHTETRPRPWLPLCSGRDFTECWSWAALFQRESWLLGRKEAFYEFHLIFTKSKTAQK